MRRRKRRSRLSYVNPSALSLTFATFVMQQSGGVLLTVDQNYDHLVVEESNQPFDMRVLRISVVPVSD